MKSDGLLDDGGIKKLDAKWNMFRFQDHLVQWISYSAIKFMEEDYQEALDAFTIVYTDARCFLDKEEKELVDIKFEKAQKAIDEQTKNQKQYEINCSKRLITTPPKLITYKAFIEFRREMMDCMHKHNLLITVVKKDASGAGGEI